MGCSRKQAARHVGVGYTTLFETIRKDQDFAERLRRAEMSQDITPLRRILDQSQTSWRAAAWILERQNPNRYARRPPRTFTAADLNAVLTDVVGFLVQGLSNAQDRATVLDRIMELQDDLAGRKRSTPCVRRALERLKRDSSSGAAVPESGTAPAESEANFRTGQAGPETAESRRENMEIGLYEQGAGI